MAEIRFDGWVNGADNIHTDFEVGPEALRRAINVDILDSGKLRRRKGATKVLDGGAHSLWNDGQGNAYFASGNKIYRFNKDMTATEIGTASIGANRLAWGNVNGAAYFTCPTARGKIASGALDVWGVDVPTSPPTMVGTGGSLAAGRYHCAMTYLLADGRESGASALHDMDLATAGGIAFAGLPVPSQAGVVAKRIYLTHANGEALFRVAEVPANAGTAFCGSFGAELRTAYLSPPPFGTAIDSTLGRIFIAVGRSVFHTEAFDFDHVDVRKNFYQFPADVSVIASTPDGLYVCADQTYFIAAAGTPEASIKSVFQFGAIAGTMTTIPNTTTPIWFSERGAIIGKDGGAAEIVAEKRIAPGAMSSAAALVREQNSLRQFIVVGDKGAASGLQCGSYAEAEITRRRAP